MGGEEAFLVALRDAMQNDRAVGPRLALAGLIDGEDARSFAMVTASTPEEARRIVDGYHEAGFLQMKLYSWLTPEVVSAVSERAHQLGMRVTGHIPSALTLEEAVQRGMDGVAHLPLLEAEGTELRSGIRFLAEHGTVVDPTLPWNELLGRAPGTAISSFEPGIEYAPSPLASSYRSVRNEVDEAEAAARLRAALYRVGAMHEAGVPLVAGTDGALPGYSLLRSVELFVAAGLSPLEAIQSASSVPAAAMGMADDVGTIEVGKRADLLIVEGNPLQEISDLRRGRWVVVEGRLYDCAQLWRSAGFRAATDPSAVRREER
jgi:imidazolonepropionase-like amidohydrolase